MGYSFLSKNNGKRPKPDYIPPPMPSIKPALKHSIEIKLTHNNIYDVCVDNAWTFSRSSYENVLTELEKIFVIFEGDRVN